MKVNVYDVIADPEPKLTVLRTINTTNDAFKTIEGAVNVLNTFLSFDKMISEQVYAIGFPNSLIPTGIFFVCSGTHNECNIDKKKLFTELLLSNSTRFACFHNHPSGMKELSTEDKIATIHYESIAKIFGLEFMGHFMVTKNYYTEVESMMDKVNVEVTL